MTPRPGEALPRWEYKGPGCWLHPQDMAQDSEWRPGLGLEASGQGLRPGWTEAEMGE